MLAAHFRRVERATDHKPGEAALGLVFEMGVTGGVFKGSMAKGWLLISTSCNKGCMEDNFKDRNNV
jgi:hypothetical protein